MAKRRKFSKEHLANLRAAHAKRRGKKRSFTVTSIASGNSFQVGDTVNLTDPPTVHTCDKACGLIDRMTQAIDKIEGQIKRLETL